jgi:hypothetical protein
VIGALSRAGVSGISNQTCAASSWTPQELAIQYAELAAFCDPIERITGRTVRSFISGIDTEADLASEMFVLYPSGDEGPSRSPKAAPEA